MSSVTGHAHGIGAAHSSSEVGAGEGGDDPGHGERRGDVDVGDAGVGIRAAHHGQVQRAGDGEVVGVAGLTGEQGGVLPAEQPVPTTSAAGLSSVTVMTLLASRVSTCPAQASTAFTMLW